jgi:hypothetical protein
MVRPFLGRRGFCGRSVLTALITLAHYVASESYVNSADKVPASRMLRCLEPTLRSADGSTTASNGAGYVYDFENRLMQAGNAVVVQTTY